MKNQYISDLTLCKVMSGQPATAQPPMPKDFEELDFSIDEEGWNEYTLADGARIRGRVFLGKIIRDPYNPNRLNFQITPPYWTVYAPAHMRGDPQPPMTPEDSRTLSKYEVRITNSHEPWNKYRILRTGQKLKVKLSIDEVHRYVDRFDTQGNPAYHVPNAVAINVTPPETKAAGQ